MSWPPYDGDASLPHLLTPQEVEEELRAHGATLAELEGEIGTLQPLTPCRAVLRWLGY